MTQYSYPWTAVAGDRTRTADTAADIYNSLNPTGVMDGLTCALSGGNVTVAAGTANVEGRYYRNTATVTLTPEASKKSYVVLRMDATSRDVSVALLAGTNTTLPALTQTAALYEVALAAVDTTVVPATVTNLDTSGTVSNTSGSWIVAYRKAGRTVTVTASHTSAVPAATTYGSSTEPTVTLPAGFRPTISVPMAAYGSSTMYPASGRVNADGTISLRNNHTASVSSITAITTYTV